MPRNLDLSALRAVVTVAESGSVTRAADLLNLTQSAVSMQIRRLEDSLGQPLFTRTQRRLELNHSGQRLADYARRMLALNDEALSGLCESADRVEVRLGVPHDIIAPQVPALLREMALAWPQLHVSLTVANSARLRTLLTEGTLDIIVTTESDPGPGGIELNRRKIAWFGIAGTRVAPDRPVRLALGRACAFRPIATETLDRAGIVWESVIEGDSDAVIEATVTAGIAITPRIESHAIAGCERLGPETGLPDLGETAICLYDSTRPGNAALDAFRDALRQAYST